MFVLDVCPCWISSVSLSCALHWGLSKTIWRMATSLITTYWGQPDQVARTTVVNGLSFGRQQPYLIQRGRSKDGVTWELIRGLGYSASSLFSCPSLSLDNLLYREDFLVCIHRVGVAFVQFGVVSGTWRLEDVRIWKLTLTYPGEKPSSLSVLTHGCNLITRKPTWHLLTMPYILVRIEAPYECRWSTRSTCPWTMVQSLTQDFLNIQKVNNNIKSKLLLLKLLPLSIIIQIFKIFWFSLTNK